MTVQNSSTIGVRPPRDVDALLQTLLSPSEYGAMQVMFGLRASLQALDGVIHHLRSPDEPSISRIHVMTLLWAADHPVPHMHLVRAMKVSRATVSGLVDGLIATGFVTAATDRGDGRNVLLTLTPAGRTAARAALERNAELLNRAFGRLSQTELDTLTSLLGKLQGSMVELTQLPYS